MKLKRKVRNKNTVSQVSTRNWLRSLLLASQRLKRSFLFFARWVDNATGNLLLLAIWRQKASYSALWVVPDGSTIKTKTDVKKLLPF